MSHQVSLSFVPLLCYLHAHIVYGKVMFSLMSVHQYVSLSIYRAAGHVIMAHDALVLTAQAPWPQPLPWPFPPDMGPPASPKIWNIRYPAMAHPASDIWWPSLGNCSNLFIGPHCKGPHWY